jgi:hypothetical protein
MRAPLTLPGRTYLLAFDRERNRLGSRTWLGYALRTAAAVDLLTTGHLADEGGRAIPVAGIRRPADPVLRAVLDEIVAAGGKKWRALPNRGRPWITKAVAAQLDADGYIRVEPTSAWWRRSRIELRDPRVVTRLADSVDAIVRGSMPIERTPPADVALVAILAVAKIRTGISRTQEREYADRIKAAIAAAGAPIDGLKHAIRQANSSV